MACDQTVGGPVAESLAVSLARRRRNRASRTPSSTAAASMPIRNDRTASTAPPDGAHLMLHAAP